MSRDTRLNRVPVAALAITTGDQNYQDMRVVCNDGTVWELTSSTEKITADNEFGHWWYQMPSIPGTDADR